jgi:N-acetylgalactosamine kinase
VARANGVDASMTRAELGEAGRSCELHIGTMSGGMDQAISSMAVAGAAARIDFEPLKATPVALPAAAAFVVANTLEESVKAVDAEKRYNKRVTEGKLAAKLVAKGEGVAAWAGITTFRHLQETLRLASPGGLLPSISRHLKAGAYSKDSLAAALGVPDLATLFEGDNKRTGALKVLASVGGGEPAFELLKRARHVCSEAERVFALQAACAGRHLAPGGGPGAPIEGGEAAVLAEMGRLMTESHASCRDDYECSSAGLDELTALALASGAAGSRLTGAGWGGCAVSLVAADKVPAFMAALTAGYYQKKGLGAQVGAALFASPPSSGAAVYTPAQSFDI